MKSIAIVIHGGAGTILPNQLTDSLKVEIESAMQQALNTAYDELNNGISALQAVETAVKILEDCIHFNAGKGSVFSNAGKHEMDASIMCGKTLDAGAVAGVSNIKNPISLAKDVLSHSDHVLLVGSGAQDFAQSRGITLTDDHYFYSEYRFNQWQAIKDSDSFQLDHSLENPDKKHGTVGAVALDMQGNIAAATSTGGMTNKRYGRVGDSPIIGSGTYANNDTCAVSCTGSGEFFMRSVVAYDLASLIEHTSLPLKEAARKVVHERMLAESDGGLIAVNRAGEVVMEFNSLGMYRGYRTRDQDCVIKIFK